ncbi:MAG: 2-C-methyl-D-erythritol 4-phosphate cytidylyltransferase [Mucinivorans sp.]
MVSTIIVAAGSGRRMGAAVPKQFIEIEGEVILMRVIKNFDYLSGEIIVVLPQDCMATWGELCRAHNFTTPHKVVAGGAERIDSVKAGLGAISHKSELVLVQDGVRPFATRSLIDRIILAAEEHGTAIPALALTDSIRSRTAGALERKELVAVQTPQAFRTDIILDAYAKIDRSTCATDDASVVETAGYPIFLVESTKENIKITTPLDLKIAKLLW